MTLRIIREPGIFGRSLDNRYILADLIRPASTADGAPGRAQREGAVRSFRSDAPSPVPHPPNGVPKSAGRSLCAFCTGLRRGNSKHRKGRQGSLARSESCSLVSPQRSPAPLCYLDLPHLRLHEIDDRVGRRGDLVLVLHVVSHLGDQGFLATCCPLPTAGVVGISSPKLISHGCSDPFSRGRSTETLASACGHSAGDERARRGGWCRRRPRCRRVRLRWPSRRRGYR